MARTPEIEAPLEPNLWGFHEGAEQRGGQHFVDLVDALRRLQDRVACCDPNAEAAVAAVAHIEQARRDLEAHAVIPGLHYSGLRADVAGRGHPLIVPVEIDICDADDVTGTVTFTEFYVGGGTAVHGGAIALAFDEILGRLGNAGLPSRTAYLNVAYRRVVPVGRQLVVSAHCTKREGRKIFIEGRLSLDGVTLADAEGLWVVLREDATADERGVIE
jgi:acyl-coenzyme A thioesterase PaaI-like protein